MKTLTIAGVDYLPYYLTDSVNIRARDGVMTATFVVPSVAMRPREGAELIYKDGARFLFGGYITRNAQQELSVGNAYYYDVEVSAYAHILTEKVARRGYENQTLQHIVLDLLSTYLDSRYDFDTTNVVTGPTLRSINFDHLNLARCFDKLGLRTGYIWKVDAERNLYFTEPTATNAPESFTDVSQNYESIEIGYDPAQCRNSVIVIGSIDGDQDVNTRTETFYGNGDARSWSLEAKPSEVVTICIDAVPQQFSLDVNERESDVFVYSFSGSSFRLTDSQPTPTGDGEEGTSQEIKIVYHPRVPIIAKEIDEHSIAFFAALDSGDGVKEFTIKDNSIKTKEEAGDRAREELRRFAMPLVNGRVITRSGFHPDGTVFEVGQVLTVNLPSFDINFNATFPIREVITTLIENEDGTEYRYEIEFGGKLMGIKELLDTLVAREGDVTDADLILTIESVSDAVTLEDAAPIMDKQTPPYKWAGAGSPTGKWGLSEWT
jgi:hypothetical protein